MSMTPRTKETIQHMLNALQSPSEELTKWEEDFIESISDQFDSRGTLSDAQFDKLEYIYAEKTD